MVTNPTATQQDMAPPPKYHEPVQGTIFHGDGREEALLTHLRSLPSLSAESTRDLSLYDQAQKVLDAIHEFGKGENRYLMNVGETKGREVEELVKSKKPKHLLNIHPSSIYPADWSADPNEDRAGYISLEKSPVYAKTAQGGFDLAGLGKVVKFVIGSSTPSLRSLRETLNMPRPSTFDMVFLDHLKPLYTIDLKVLEEEGLIGPGTMLVADNVVKPGNPAYLSYVRATPRQKRESLQTERLTEPPAPTTNPTTDEEWQKAFFDGPIPETRWSPPECEGLSADGDPGLVYSSEMVGGWDPYTGERDACEVSICKGRED